MEKESLHQDSWSNQSIYQSYMDTMNSTSKSIKENFGEIMLSKEWNDMLWHMEAVWVCSFDWNLITVSRQRSVMHEDIMNKHDDNEDTEELVAADHSNNVKTYSLAIVDFINGPVEWNRYEIAFQKIQNFCKDNSIKLYMPSNSDETIN